MNTVKSIPMTRSYINFKTDKVIDNHNRELKVSISWYYISPCEILLTMEPRGEDNGEGKSYISFTYDLGIDWDNLTFLDITSRRGIPYLYYESPLRFGIEAINYESLPTEWDTIRYHFRAKLTTDDHFKLYPINVDPGPNITYPIIA